eukprot:SM000025S08366  [mRNA]  locus=s25:344008:346710:+ [translate_table: standard]
MGALAVAAAAPAAGPSEDDGKGGDGGSRDEAASAMSEGDEPEGDDAVHVFAGHSGARRPRCRRRSALPLPLSARSPLERNPRVPSSSLAGPVYTVACSPAELGLVASGGGDDVAYLWRIGADDEPARLAGHGDSVVALAFSHDGALLATGGLDGLVHVWDAASGRLLHKLEGPGEGIEWLQWHPRGHVVVAGSEDFTAWMWNADSADCLAVFSGHAGAVTCGSFTPDGKAVVTGSEDATLRIWSPKSGEVSSVIQGHGFHSEGLTSLRISNDSFVAVTGSTDNTARVVSLQSHKVVGALAEHTDSVESVGLCSCLPMAATGSLDGKVILWDLNTLQVGVVKILWHPSSPLVYAGDLSGSVRVWDGRTGNVARMFQGHRDSLLDLAITSDGAFILSGSDDHTARVFGM